MEKANLLNTILCRLSDAQFYVNIDASDAAIRQINIAKAILLYIADEKTDIGRIDVDTEEIDEMLKRVKLL